MKMNNPNNLRSTDVLIQGIDISEQSLRTLDDELLRIMLIDRTTRKNILWATTDYADLGNEFSEFAEITPDIITNKFAGLIQPRVTKSINSQSDRTRTKAEVFTPSWLCNRQNNLIDEQWFRRTEVFNIESEFGWTTIKQPIDFSASGKSWQKYVDTPRLEVSCGEAPYLVSRYDTVSGENIPLMNRIGLLDRKMRVIRENAISASEWLKWSQRAFESVYGFEYQGDSLLLARENLLYTYIEYYVDWFREMPDVDQLRKIARIISWNIWQMDGLKFVVPGSCKPEELYQLSIFNYIDMSDSETPVESQLACPGCLKNDIYAHTGIYCKIMDWRSNSSQTYISMLKGGAHHG